ncbi:MAG: ABC transporter ATP-binding protein [Chloroflexi bacterium]|nr:ABC transporter ATP-binding protein [Chloroflexota bacterium]
MLSVRSVSAWYDDVQALHEVSIDVEKGEVVAVLGANGAGKTTLLRTISGLLRKHTGEILLDGTRIERFGPERISVMGVSHVPQGRRIFPGLTVNENLIVGGVEHVSGKVLEENMDKVYSLFPQLAERRRQLGWSLSGGEQQMLAMGRALVSDPKIMILDEPSLGLAPVVVRELFRAIDDSRRTHNLTILVVEQNAHMALQIADRGYVMESGRVVLADTAAALGQNPLVREAYLGG